MEFDKTKYRQLMRGERVQDGDMILTESGPMPAGCAWWSTLIDGCPEIFLRPLPQEKVAEFKTGAVRSDADGRGRFDLIPFEGILPLAKRFELGAKRFGDRNWEKGQPTARLLESMRRHAQQVNEDFSEDHIGAVMWNACALATIVSRIKAGRLPVELDDAGYIEREKGTQ